MRGKTVQKGVVHSETTRTKIMNESIKLFAGKGYAATSVKDISTAAGVNIAAVNYHFESKENLYKQLLNKFAETGVIEIKQILKPPKNADEFKVRLELFLSSGIDHIVQYPDLPRMLMKNIDLMPQLSEETFHKTFEQFHHIMVVFFESAQKNGIVRKELDHKLIAQFLDNQMFALIHKAAIERTLKKNIDDPKFRKKWLDQTLDLFFNGALEK